MITVHERLISSNKSMTQSQRNKKINKLMKKD